MIQVRKVIEHVYEKVLGQGSDAGSQAAGSNASQEKEPDKEEELSSIAEERVELLCSDQVQIVLWKTSMMLLVLTFLNHVLHKRSFTAFHLRSTFSFHLLIN